MNTDLRFNMGNLVISYHEINPETAAAVSPPLSYACRFWGDHLALSGVTISNQDELRYFFAEKFLFWLEVVSLTSAVGRATMR